MSRRERHALLLLVGLGLLGHGLQWAGLERGRAPGSITLLTALPEGGLAAHRMRSARAARPLAPGERVDLNRAPAEEIARLPRIGMRLAKALVRARTEAGGFGSWVEVDRVAGVGPGVLALLDSLATLGDTLRVQRGRPSAPGRAVSREPATAGSRPGGGPAIWSRDLPVEVRSRAARGAGAGAGGGPGTPVDLNRASESDLIRLKGIGPARARAIVAYRQSHGPFASIADLERVPGLSARLVRQLAPQVTIR